MTTLLIDIGNTALKWSTSDSPDKPVTVVHHGKSEEVVSLFWTWHQLTPRAIYLCNVVDSTLARTVVQFCQYLAPLTEIKSAEGQMVSGKTLVNQYMYPDKLGSDRWAASLGALHLSNEEALIVAHMGTASTVDSIQHMGEQHYAFLGGRIAPGPSMMLRGLKSIEGLSKINLGTYDLFPRSTQDAMATGIIDAQVGLVLRAVNDLVEKGVKPKVLLGGGAAGFIAPHLQAAWPHMEVRHNLVLHGMAAMVNGH